MATYTVVNGSDKQLSSINVGAVNVDAYSYKDGVTLTATELAALLTFATGETIAGQHNVCVFADLTGDAQATQRKRSAALASLYVSAQGVVFYPVTGALVGLYEAVAIAFRKSHRSVPTVSTWAARRRSRRTCAVVWALGLVVHLARHKVD